MESVNRIGLFLATYTENTNVDHYAENKNILENIVCLPLEHENNRMRICAVLYNNIENKWLSVMHYGRETFIGIYQDGTISFTDFSTNFQYINESVLLRLKLRVENSINMDTQTELKSMQSAWIDTLPLIHAVSIYESYIDAYEPQARTNGTYDTTINALVEAYESLCDNDLDLSDLYLAVEGHAPSFIKAWELYVEEHNPDLEVRERKISLCYPDILDRKAAFMEAHKEYSTLYVDCNIIDNEPHFILYTINKDAVAIYVENEFLDDAELKETIHKLDEPEDEIDESDNIGLE